MGARLAELSLTLRDLLSQADSPHTGDGRVAAIEGGAHESEGSAVIVHEPPQQQAAAVAVRAEVIAVARPLPHHS